MAEVPRWPAMTLNDRRTPLSLLQTRRSGKPRDLIAPGPDAAQLATILSVAARTPDHGKLSPWRFVVIADRDAFARLLHDAAATDPTAPDTDAREQFARQAPVLVAVLFTPVGDLIPLWEQELSAGAACMNLLHAAHALGFAGGWLTGWAAFSPKIVAALGGGMRDRVAGYLFLGTVEREPPERPRPEPDSVVRFWPQGSGRPA